MQIALTLVGPDADLVQAALGRTVPALAAARARVKEPRPLGPDAIDLAVEGEDLISVRHAIKPVLDDLALDYCLQPWNGRRKLLMEKRVSTLMIPEPNGKRIIYWNQDAQWWVLDLASGEKHSITKGVPAMFADTGLPLFFKALVGLRAERSNLRIFVTGGASVIAGQDPFKIGERNTRVTLDFLTNNRLNVLRTDTGGSISRTVHLELSTGNVNLITPAGKSQQSLAA